MHDSPLQLILQAGLVVKLVLLLLLICSVVSWAIILYKQGVFWAAARGTAAFLKAFGSGLDGKQLVTTARSLKASPLANVFAAVAEEPHSRNRDDVTRLLRRREGLESNRLYSYLTFLATTGSTSPFIGLFGTVWGIMDAFRGIGEAGSASLAVVAPGIAEALITTAVGLAAAIPAVMAYNYFLSRGRRLTAEMEDFSEELLDYFTRDGARRAVSAHAD